ncbi:Rrp15p-domain-containing protein [Annulohypoxylon maeteangense]|uniref:Rrp15p-domain-containing protein n=1 Tax=Annulohypoxylon maeteangense TaxID=1927788 RepID=UPI002008D9A4|nr:Rrp15p-domain-containing protein [Annulohypoxylon maeteangense]KAI0883090.1 Rrp15p-domain-containing protein [Annulohypoxylon maeteangense]
MAGPNIRKRNRQDFNSKSKSQRPNKKQRKALQYHSDSDEEGDNSEFKPVNLLDSDNEDLDDILVDDVPSGSDSDSGSDSESEIDLARTKLTTKQRKTPAQKHATDAPKSDDSKDEPEGSEDGDEYEDVDDDDDEGDEGTDSDDGQSTTQKTKSKRNDPDAFATSMSKILSTKLSTTRRADPVLSRSAEAHQAAKDAVDNALEAKARKHMREQKRLAQEKGRVKDILVGIVDEETGVPETTTQEIQQTEKRLKKVAHRGVIMLFRAVREAQERAAEADRDTRKDGIVGVQRRQEKVNEMSKQGFLDLIAGGGGKLKKGALEEA